MRCLRTTKLRGERVYLVEYDPDARKLGFPDVAVTEIDRSQQTSAQSTGIATLEPITIPLTILEGPRETYIEILHHRASPGHGSGIAFAGQQGATRARRIPGEAAGVTPPGRASH